MGQSDIGKINLLFQVCTNFESLVIHFLTSQSPYPVAPYPCRRDGCFSFDNQLAVTYNTDDSGFQSFASDMLQLSLDDKGLFVI